MLEREFVMLEMEVESLDELATCYTELLSALDLALLKQPDNDDLHRTRASLLKRLAEAQGFASGGRPDHEKLTAALIAINRAIELDGNFSDLELQDDLTKQLSQTMDQDAQ